MANAAPASPSGSVATAPNVVQTLATRPPEIPVLKNDNDLSWIKLGEDYSEYVSTCEKNNIIPKTIDYCLKGEIRLTFRLGILGQDIDDPDTIKPEKVLAEIERSKVTFHKGRENQVFVDMEKHLETAKAYDLSVDNVDRRVGKLKAQALLHLHRFGYVKWGPQKKVFRQKLMETLIKQIKPEELRVDLLRTVAITDEWSIPNFFEDLKEKAEALDKAYRMRESAGLGKRNGKKTEQKKTSEKYPQRTFQQKKAKQTKSREWSDTPLPPYDFSSVDESKYVERKGSKCSNCWTEGHYFLRFEKESMTWKLNCKKPKKADPIEELKKVQKYREKARERFKALKTGKKSSENNKEKQNKTEYDKDEVVMQRFKALLTRNKGFSEEIRELLQDKE